MSERFDNSNGVFGYYDDIPTGTYNIPIGGGITVGFTAELNSGLGNTLIVTAAVGDNVSLEVLFGPGGHGFDTNLLISGGISIAGVDLAGITLAGDGFLLEVNGSDTYYPADNLSAFTSMLESNGASSPVAEALTASLSEALQTLGNLEEAIQQLLDGLQPGNPGTVFIPIPLSLQNPKVLM